MNLTCPCCFAAFPVEAALESAAGRELMGVLAGAGAMARPLAAYLGLFRSATRALAWERALRLAREVLELAEPGAPLQQALAETVEAMRLKRERGDARPLKNHNYLKQVLGSVAQTHGTDRTYGIDGTEQPKTQAKGKRRLAIEMLAAWAGADWLRVEIAQGLQALCALPHLTPPGTDAIELTAGVYETVIRRRVNIESVDGGRITAAFGELLKRPLKEWPDPAEVLGQLPRRPERTRIAEHNPDDVTAGREFFQQMSRKL